MENSFFIYTEKGNPVQIERFHICFWEFNNNSSLVEFGFEISNKSLINDDLTIFLFIPWAEMACQTKDLYERLKISDNSRFIFNDSINSTRYLKNHTESSGVIHTFSGRNELCVLPSDIQIREDKIITATINLNAFRELKLSSNPNVYFRFSIKPLASFISIRKDGVGKSTIIYDIKVNERRCIPDDRIVYFDKHEFSKIKYCFSFNILPNKYDIVHFDNTSLKNVRTLEFESFNKYLNDKRVKKDELIVVFNKKEVKEFEKLEIAESFSFFSIYSKERIGKVQVLFAILINIICGFLFFIASNKDSLKLDQSYFNLPYEIIFAVILAIIAFLYFVWPSIQNKFYELCNLMSKK